MRPLNRSGSGLWQTLPDDGAIPQPDPLKINENPVPVRMLAMPITGDENATVENQTQETNRFNLWKQSLEFNNQQLGIETYFTRSDFFTPGIVSGCSLSIDVSASLATIVVSAGDFYSKKMERCVLEGTSRVITEADGHYFVQVKSSDDVKDKYKVWQSGDGSNNSNQYYYDFYAKVYIESVEDSEKITIGEITKTGTTVTLDSGLPKGSWAVPKMFSDLLKEDTGGLSLSDAGQAIMGGTGVTAHDDINKALLEWCTDNQVSVKAYEYKYGSRTQGQSKFISYLLQDADGFGTAYKLSEDWKVDNTVSTIDLNTKIGGRIDNRNAGEGFSCISVFHEANDSFKGIGIHKVPTSSSNTAVSKNQTGISIDLEIQGMSGTNFPARGYVVGQRLVIYDNYSNWVYAQVTAISSDTVIVVNTSTLGYDIPANSFATVIALDMISPIVLTGGTSNDLYSEKWSLLGYFKVDGSNKIIKTYSPKSEVERKYPERFWVPQYILDEIPEFNKDSSYQLEDKYEVGDIVMRATSNSPKRGYLLNGSALAIEEYPLAFKDLGFTIGYGTPVAITGTINISNGSNIVTGLSSNYLTDLRTGFYVLIDGVIYKVTQVSDDSTFTLDVAITSSTQSGLTLYQLTEFQIPKAGDHFIRIYDGTATTDGASRYNILTSATVGDLVASGQADAIQGHKHDDSGHTHPNNVYNVTGAGAANVLSASNLPTSTIDTGYASLGDPVASTYGTPNLSTENRPKNILLALYYIADK